MPILDVDGLKFDFDADWSPSKCDEWGFYRNQWSRMWNGIKSVDLIAVAPDKTAWLIEVKDYRQHARTKTIDLAAEVAHKTFDTLAAMLPAKLSANDDGESAMAGSVLAAKKLRVVLHLEQPKKHSALRPRAINPADVQQDLKRLITPIDAHPFVAESSRMGSLGWKVT